MKHYLLFVLVAAATVCSPGPGVILTLTNSLRHGLYGAFGGILGIALGAFVVAAVSATSAGLVLAASASVFVVMKYVGAAYLFYLGIKLWRAPAFEFKEKATASAGFGKRFLEGIALQLTNPKAIFFFLSIFPQFIEMSDDYSPQFFALVITYSFLVVIIHFFYALLAHRAKAWLISATGGRLLNKAGGITFMFFGVALAKTNR